jgi:hypothetical protein
MTRAPDAQGCVDHPTLHCDCLSLDTCARQYIACPLPTPVVAHPLFCLSYSVGVGALSAHGSYGYLRTTAGPTSALLGESHLPPHLSAPLTVRLLQYQYFCVPCCRAMPCHVDYSVLAERRLCLFSGTTLSTHQQGLSLRV